MSQFLKINLVYYKYKYNTICIITNIYICILLVLLFWRTLASTGFFALPFELMGCAFNPQYVEHLFSTSCSLVIHENIRLTFSELYFFPLWTLSSLTVLIATTYIALWASNFLCKNMKNGWILSYLFLPYLLDQLVQELMIICVKFYIVCNFQLL